MESIKQTIMRRDNMSAEDADQLITDAKNDLYERLGNGEMPEDICAEWFGLEPDFIMELI